MEESGRPINFKRLINAIRGEYAAAYQTHLKENLARLRKDKKIKLQDDLNLMSPAEMRREVVRLQRGTITVTQAGGCYTSGAVADTCVIDWLAPRGMHHHSHMSDFFFFKSLGAPAVSVAVPTFWLLLVTSWCACLAHCCNDHTFPPTYDARAWAGCVRELA
jgi:hypothetical protein